MKRPTPPTRSLTEVPGWIKKTCERCEGDFWSVPSQAKFTRFCAKDCRHEDVLARLLKDATTNEQGCLIFAGALNSDGYGNIKYQGEQWRAHRLMWHLKVGPIPADMDVLHKCKKVRACIRLDHLYLGTDIENGRDKVEQDTAAKGEAHGNAELTVEKVKEIKALKDAGLTLIVVAEKFHVSIHTIWSIWNGRTWKDV